MMEKIIIIKIIFIISLPLFIIYAIIKGSPLSELKQLVCFYLSNYSEVWGLMIKDMEMEKLCNDNNS